MNIIQSLALDIANGWKTKVYAAVILSEMAGFPHSKSMEVLTKETRRRVNIQMQMEIRDQEDQLDNEQWERDYESGVMA